MEHLDFRAASQSSPCFVLAESMASCFCGFHTPMQDLVVSNP